MQRFVHRSVLLVMVVVLGIGCAGTSTDSSGRSSAPGEQQSTAQRQGPKTISMTVKAEPNVLVTNLDTVGSTIYANGAVHPHVNSYLTLDDPNAVTTPILAAELPSLDNGSIKLLDDGRMETTWKLRPGSKWHDGTPITPKDVVFSWQVSIHPTWPVRNPVARTITGMESPDPQTIVMTWREPSRYAANLTRGTLDLLPAHKLEAAWAENPDVFPTNPYFTDANAFVGSGAFRVVQWERGSSMTIEAFPDYYFGKPRLDRIIFKFVLDPRVAISNLLAGAVDLVNNGLGYDEVQVIEDRWKPTNGGITSITVYFYRFLNLQYRPDEARPRGYAADQRVRRALMYAINREQLSDGVSPGSGNRFVAHTPVPPTTPEGMVIDRAVPKHPYDPNRAQQLFQEAGWTRGSDGVLVKDGERFSTTMRNSTLTDGDKAYQLMQLDLRQVGVELTNFESESTPNPVDYATYPGFLFTTTSSSFLDRWDSRNVASAQNRWSGANGSGYSNPAFDRMNDELLRAIRIDDQHRHTAEGWRLLYEDVGQIPLYFFPNATAIRKGINIPVPQTTQVYWQSHLWDVE